MRKHALTVFAAIPFILIATIALAETAITSLPATISTSGSYYLSSNLSTTSTSSPGITVSVDNVTIDFRGHTIKWTGTSGTPSFGVSCSASNIEIKNGSVVDFATGIFGYSDYSAHRAINMRVTGSLYEAIDLRGTNNLVKDCTSDGNDWIGINAGGGSVVTGNTVCENGYGISAGYGSTVSNNSVYNNGATGICVSNGSTVIGNSVYGNEKGIYIKDFIAVVKNNTVTNNGREGIKFFDTDGRSLIDGNTVYDNNQEAGGYPNIGTCTYCTFGSNYAP